MSPQTNNLTNTLWTQAAALVGVVLVSFGLYRWSLAEAWAAPADRVEVAAWSVRCGGAAAIAVGQVLFALIVIPGFFNRDGQERGLFEQAYALVAGLVAVLALVAAGALYAAAGW